MNTQELKPFIITDKRYSHLAIRFQDFMKHACGAISEPNVYTNRAALPIQLAVGIATRGRPSVLADTLNDLSNQLRAPDTIYVSYTTSSDIEDAYEHFPNVNFILSNPGLTKQRNAILEALMDELVIIFLDDDFYLDREYISIIEQVFVHNSDIVVATGSLLADGINGPGLTMADAKSILALPRKSTSSLSTRSTFNAYGCNMCLRVQPIRDHSLRFDENLPLYGWYEDVDFSRQLALYGQITRLNRAYGVHLGVKSGRQSGLQLGYSQVANPVYLAKKKSVSWTYAFTSMTSRSIKNLLYSLAPEPFVDRRGRLKGNFRGWFELFTGTLSPKRILEMR